MTLLQIQELAKQRADEQLPQVLVGLFDKLKESHILDSKNSRVDCDCDYCIGLSRYVRLKISRTKNARRLNDLVSDEDENEVFEIVQERLNREIFELGQELKTM